MSTSLVLVAGPCERTRKGLSCLCIKFVFQTVCPIIPVVCFIWRVLCCVCTVPFEEDDKDPEIWFLDHSYMENMYRMFKKVNAREKIVGWYSTGPKIREADLDINALMAKYSDFPPVLVVCEVQVRVRARVRAVKERP